MSDISNKTHRLASAIYLITDFFADSEPLKWKLRNLAIDLASERVKDKISLVREITSLFSIALTTNLVSQANFEILKSEFAKFERDSESPLNQVFLATHQESEPAFSPVYVPEVKRDKIEIAHTATTTPTQRIAHPLKDFGAVSVKKNSRQSTIISLLKRKKEIMIKDISAIIDGCSEKTIQRELLAMVSAGILRKIGEKRWSRYTLA